MKADWIIDYDSTTDKCYKRPGCKKCQAPVDSNGECFSCGEKYELDADMKKWLDEMEDTKIKMWDCDFCGGKECLETVFYKNPVTMKWQAGHGECKKCGARFIV